MECSKAQQEKGPPLVLPISTTQSSFYRSNGTGMEGLFPSSSGPRTEVDEERELLADFINTQSFKRSVTFVDYGNVTWRRHGRGEGRGCLKGPLLNTRTFIFPYSPNDSDV